MNYTGLTNEEVIKSREKYGSNIFSKKKQDSFLKLLMETLTDPIIKILLIALGIKIIFLIRDFDWYETVGIVIAILIASLISSVSEYGSMRAFNKLLEESSNIPVKVKRNGQAKNILIGDVVVGDTIILEPGDKVPADGVILTGNISLDESMMNGEGREVYKGPGNNLYMNTVVYSGRALMKVNSIGDNTTYGKMLGELQEDNTESPLRLRLSKLANDISKIGYICSLLVALSYLFYMIVISNNFNINDIAATLSNGRMVLGYILDALTLCVSIIVVSVPEGLPMMITLVLSSNMKRMLKDNVLVRKLVGIETAGNINVLFTDKTGTLTKGNLEVGGFLDGGGNLISYELISDKLKELYSISMYINNESVYDKGNDKIIGGNITDRALLDYVKEYRVDYELIERSSFDSKVKYMYTKIRYKGKRINLVKGAYEKVIPLCNSYYDQFGNKQILKKDGKLDKIIDSVSFSKYRVLALAINMDRETINNMTLLGFVLLGDMVRERVPEGIDLVKKAGIQTIMITGDNKETAYGIAREIGLVDSDDDLILTHDKIDIMSDMEIAEIFPKIKVIARAMPEDKRRLVEIAKGLDLVVGMTGDGVNDALALKKADVGFAMGSGTEVAKEASDIVILDDNFYSITNAILYGRTIFKSIRKFIICQLTINFCSLCVSIIGPFVGIPVPITVVQMLWINMIMDTLSGFAFSYEPALKEYMLEAPKKKSDNIINSYMLNQIVVTGLASAILSLFFLKSNLTKQIFNDNLLTAFFGLIIFISILNSFAARTHRLNILANIGKNKVFILVITFVFLMQIYLIYRGGEVFRTNGLSIREFIIMFLFSLSVIPVDFIRKLILKLRGYKLGV